MSRLSPDLSSGGSQSSAVRKASGWASSLLILFLFCATALSLAAWGLDRLLSAAAGIHMDIQLYEILASILPTVLGAAAAIFAAQRLSGLRISSLFVRTRPRPGIFLYQFGLCLGLNLAASFLTELAAQWLNWGRESASPPDFSYSAEAPVLSAALILSSCLIAPVLEEVIFRGYILQSLRRFGSGFAAFFSALLFALYHFNLAQLLPAFFMGCFFGYLAMSCGSLYPVIAIHILNNAVSVLLSALSSVLSERSAAAVTIVLYAGALACLMAAVPVFLKRRRNTGTPDLKERPSLGGSLGAAMTSPVWILLVLLYLFRTVAVDFLF